MIKIATIIGARPQFIKAAAISNQIKTNYPNVEEVLIHTGQHYDHNMSDIFFNELELRAPQYNLAVGSDLHGAQTAKMLTRIEEVLIAEQPNAIIIYGDTNSTLAAAVAAAKLNISIAHIEAGLRSFNRKMPEEINRIVADHLADFLFAPTKFAFERLHKEGIDSDQIYLSGDVMYDVALYFQKKAQQKSSILTQLNLTVKNYVLVTVHRAESTDNSESLSAIVEAICQMAETTTVLFPLHPRTKHALDKQNLLHKLIKAQVKVVEPFGFLDMIQVEMHASLIMTDSGGVQKEAFFYQVPCVTLRTETEWTELVELGWNYLAAPTTAGNILDMVATATHARVGEVASPYGQGDAAKKIMDVLITKLA